MKNHDIDSIVEINCPLCDCREGRIISRYIGKTGRFLSAENIVTCTQCGLEFVHPLPGKDELDNYYSQGAYYHDSQPDTGQFFDFSSHLARSKIKLIKKYFNDDCFQKIIDIGAGNAAFGCTVKRLYPESIYHAVEPDRAVTSRYGIYVNNVFEWLDDIEDCDYTLAVVSQVLEHVIDPLAFLQSISSVMAPGGGDNY